MRITPAELTALRAKRAAPAVSSWRDGTLTLVVPGALKNPLNARWHYYTRARWSRTWHEKTAGAILEADQRQAWRAISALPRHVHFHAYVQRLFDSDGLQAALHAALKPCRDALVVYGVLSGDAERDGHVFTCQQEKSAWRGVVVTVRARGLR